MLTKMAVKRFYWCKQRLALIHKLAEQMFLLSLNFISTREWRRRRPFLPPQFRIFIYAFSALHWALPRLDSNKNALAFCTALLRFSKSLRCSFSIKVSMNQIQNSSVWLWPNCLTIKHPHILLRRNSGSSY